MKYLLYYFKEDEQLIQFVQDKYVDAVIEINDKYFQNKSKYLVYFKLNLGRLINQTCVVLNQRFLFNTERCLEMLDEALMLDSTFNKVMFLKGYFTEIDPIYRKICHHYYQKALQEEGDKPYTSSFYYKLGSLCEFSEQGDNQTEYYYQKALQLNPNAYQAVYKLLLHDIKNTKYITALESAKRICNILDVKNSANYLLPQEYIYFNAGKYMEWYINSHYLCNQTAAFRARKEQNDLLFKIQTKENEIYRQIFTTESEKYLEKTYKKLKLPK